MRVDGGSSNANPVNPYNAATEKTLAARRPCQARKKLAKRATAGSQAWAGFDQAPVIAQWMSGERGKTPGKEQHNASAEGKSRSGEAAKILPPLSGEIFVPNTA